MLDENQHVTETTKERKRCCFPLPPLPRLGHGERTGPLTEGRRGDK